jgi:outer membrane lipoprotein SlyB
MTRTLTILTAAATLAFAAGCSSVKDNTPTEAYGSVGSAPYSSAPAYSNEAMQYGYVRNITQMDTTRRTSGAGAILGAVVGGVVGNQIGQGSGRALATGAGAIAGAVAGNKLEENRNEGSARAYYQVDVRLDSGDMRSFDYYDLNGLRVGDRVRVENGQLQRW